MPKRVAIVGGGITGMVAAYELEKLTDAEIDLYEASDRLGGKIGSQSVGQLLVEGGPDCFFARKPGVMEFVEELGLTPELIEPRQGEFFMYVGGALSRVPHGLVTLNAAQPGAVEEAEFLSDAAKREVLNEPNQPVGDGQDESIRAFFTRRFGGEFSRLVAEPLLAGTHAGDAAQLSMAALFPGYLEQEHKFGSLTAGAQPPSGKPSFLSFRDGMQTLVDGVQRKLIRTRIHLNHPVKSITDFAADATVIAIPANKAASLISPISIRAASILGKIEHRSSAIVTLAFRRAEVEHPLDGTGFLVPQGEHAVLAGATWSSQKWAERSPANMVLIRVFLGGELNRNEFTTMSDGVLAETAFEAIKPILHLHHTPRVAMVKRWVDALPQYKVGHLERMADMQASLPSESGIYFAGTSYFGVGVPDCINQGRNVAKTLSERL